VTVAPPVIVSVVPLPLAAGLMVPDTVSDETAVKSTPLTLTPPAIVTDRLAGVKATLALDGLTVYVPSGTPLNVYAPAGSVVPEPVIAVPVTVTVVPAPIAAGVTVPLNETNATVKFTAETFAPLTVID
jgi:hypothetical protein